MLDNIAIALVAFGTITTAAMTLTEWYPLPILRHRPPPQKTRRRLSCFAYSFLGGVLAWVSGFVEMAQAASWWRSLVGLVLMAAISTILAHAAVSVKKKVKK